MHSRIPLCCPSSVFKSSVGHPFSWSSLLLGHPTLISDSRFLTPCFSFLEFLISYWVEKKYSPAYKFQVNLYFSPQPSQLILVQNGLPSLYPQRVLPQRMGAKYISFLSLLNCLYDLLYSFSNQLVKSQRAENMSWVLLPHCEFLPMNFYTYTH